MTIRALTAADRTALASFTCARLGEPWAEAVQDEIREDLADHIVAVAVSERRKGHGRSLKEAVIAAAKDAGAMAVASIVHRSNTAMISLNRQLGAIVEEIPDDRDHCRCMIGPLQRLDRAVNSDPQD